VKDLGLPRDSSPSAQNDTTHSTDFRDRTLKENCPKIAFQTWNVKVITAKTVDFYNDSG
jgi:hypothetical protein